MQRAKGSWAKVAVMTALICVCAGLVYGWQSAENEKQEKYKRALEFNFARHYGSVDRQIYHGVKVGVPWVQKD